MTNVPHARGRWTAASASCLLLGAGLLTACSEDGGSGSVAEPSSRPTASAAPQDPGDGASAATTTPAEDLTPIEVAPQVRRQARNGVADYVTSVSDALADPEAVDGAALSTDPQGTAHAQMLSLANEYAENGWRVEGRPRVVDVEVVDRTADPATLKVAVCIDNSTVTVLDSNGDPAGLPGNRTDRSLNLLTLVPDGDDWVVREQTFPDDPSC